MTSKLVTGVLDEYGVQDGETKPEYESSFAMRDATTDDVLRQIVQIVPSLSSKMAVRKTTFVVVGTKQGKTNQSKHACGHHVKMSV